MNSLDHQFWINLANLKNQHEKIGRILKYTDHDGIPLDLNDIKNQTQIGSFENWATKLEDAALEFSEIAETIRTYPSLIEKDFLEREMETLPSEGNPGVAVGG